MAKKPGKYDHIVANLTPLPPEDPSYQEKVDAYKAVLRKDTVFTPESLALKYRELRLGSGNPIDAEFTETLIDLLGDEGICDLKSECGKRMLAVEQMLIASHDGDEPGWGEFGAGDHTVKLRDGGSVSVQSEPVGKVINKEEFRVWCVKDGLENSLQLWPSTMNAIVKKRCLDGLDAPDGIKVYSKDIVKLRKG